MGQMFDKTGDQMNNWRWDNPRAFRDQVDLSNLQTPSSGNVIHYGERFSKYGSADLRAKSQPPSCWQYNPGDLLAIWPLNWDLIIDEDDDDENWADPGLPSGGSSHAGNDNDYYDSEGEKDTHGGENGTGKGKGTKDGKGKVNGKAMEEKKGKGNGKGKGIVKKTPWGDDLSCAIALQVQKEIYVADSDIEG